MTLKALDRELKVTVTDRKEEIKKGRITVNYMATLTGEEVEITIKGSLPTIEELKLMSTAHVLIERDQTTLTTEDENSDPCRCKYCGLQYETQEELDEHVRTIHGKEDEET